MTYPGFVSLVIGLLTVLPCAAQQTPPGKAPPGKSMEITVMRGSGTLCEPNCPEWIAAQGPITAETPARLRQVMQSLKGRKLPVLLHSLGGDVDAAIAMARMIRAAGLNTAIAKSEAPAVCAKEDKACLRERSSRPPKADFTFRGAGCVSACTFVLAGGMRRVTHPAAYLGVHQAQAVWINRQLYRRYYVERRRINGRLVEVSRRLVSERVISETTTKRETPPDAMNRKIGDHLSGMGIAPAFHELTKATPHEKMRYLTVAEQLSQHIATDAYNQITALGFDKDNPYFSVLAMPSKYFGYAFIGVYNGGGARLEITAKSSSKDEPITLRVIGNDGAMNPSDFTLAFHLPDETVVEAKPKGVDRELVVPLSLGKLCRLHPFGVATLTLKPRPSRSDADDLSRTSRLDDLLQVGAIQSNLCPEKRWES